MKQSILFITIILFAISCQKKDNTSPNPANVAISISSPAKGQVFHIGDTTHMKATVSYPSELHGYEMTITDSATGNVLFDADEHVHDDHFDIAQTFVYADTVAATLKLDLTVEIDHNGNQKDTTLYFYYRK
jgi:hypothetical protein